MRRKNKVVLVWENFGPGHIDRCEALAAKLANLDVVGLELFPASETYEWNRSVGVGFRHLTLFEAGTSADYGSFKRYFRSAQFALSERNAVYFLCHYERLSTFLLACTLRLFGNNVYVMNDSKFDDYPRNLLRELGKALFYLPYAGALCSGIRSRDYVRFLGIPAERIRGNYNAINLDRIRSLAGDRDVQFEDRYFIIIARLVDKKNLFVTLQAYAAFLRQTKFHRPLHIFGDGPLKAALLTHANMLNVQQHIVWHGFAQSAEVSRGLAGALALLLLSTEEQFGNVVIEAQALCLPCIVSTQVGARDQLIRSAQTGFVVEPDNAEGAAYFMLQLSDDELLWRKMSDNVKLVATHGDSDSFASAIADLIGSKPSAQ